jgi:hypothetical protein
MELADFTIGGISTIAPGTVAGDIQFRLQQDNDDDPTASDWITVKISRAPLGPIDTLEALEAKLLQIAADRLARTAEYAAKESVNSLRQRTADFQNKQREREVALFQADLQPKP